MDYIIVTNRLGLRNWSDSDRLPFAKMNGDKEVMKYFPSTLSQKKSNEYITRYREIIDKNGHGPFAADLLETGEFIGLIGLGKPSFESDFTPCTEIGWRLGKAFWNRGLATEGAKACLDYGFGSAGLKEIFSFTPLQNAPSERVMQKIGMTRIGTFDHPLVDSDSGLKKHVLYRIEAK